MKITYIIILSAFIIGNALYAKSVECWSTDQALRQTGGSGEEHQASSRFYLSYKITDDEPVLEKVHGHLEIVAYPDEPTLKQVSSYYGVFAKKQVKASLSKRASKYKDA